MAVAHVDGDLVALGYQQINDLSSASTLTVPTGARIALIQCRDQAVRWRDDGTSPIGTVGMVIDAGFDFWYTGGNAGLTAIKFIEVTAGAELNISYYSA